MRLAALIVAAALAADLPAEPVPKRYFVDESYAIVIGRLMDTTVTQKGQVDHGTGVVMVDSIVSGPAKLERQYPFTWRHSPETATMCPPSFDFRQVTGYSGIWFLERAADGSIRPMGEFWSLHNADSIEYYLQQLQSMDPKSERVKALNAIFREKLDRMR